MKKTFIDRVIAEGIVDTRNYRYTTRIHNGATEQYLEVIRLPIIALDTTYAIDGWEVIATVK